MMTKKLTLLLIAILSFSGPVSAGIGLSKNRLVFDSKQRSDALQFRNTSNNPMKFSINMHLVEMSKDGKLIRVEESEDSAIKLIRYSPKRGSVISGGKQVVRFSVRRPPSLKEGEYRAVLNIKTELETPQSTAISMKPTINYNMPVIVRHGALSADTSLQKPRLINVGDTPHIELWQTREGNRSLFGNFIVTDNNDSEIGALNGVAVYTPLNERRILIPINTETNASSLNIQYQEVAEFGGNLSSSTSLSL